MLSQTGGSFIRKPLREDAADEVESAEDADEAEDEEAEPVVSMPSCLDI